MAKLTCWLQVNMKFAELVEELDLSAPNKAAMLSLPIEKKWQIWASRRGAAEESSTGLSSNPEDYTARWEMGVSEGIGGAIE